MHPARKNPARAYMRRALAGPLVVTAALLGASCGSSAATPRSPSTPPSPSPPGCAPTPCAKAAGLTVEVTSVASTFSPSAAAGSTPDPSTHLVLVHVQATARVTTLLPATAFHLRGADSRLLPADTIEGGEECQAIGDGITAAPQAPAAPTPVCFDIAHAAFSDFSLIVDLPGRGQLTIPLPPA